MMSTHHYRSDTIPQDGSIDIEFLRQLFDGDIPGHVESCCAIEGTLKKSPKCGEYKALRATRYLLDI